MNENSYNEKAVYLQAAELLVLLQGQDIQELFIFRELEGMELSYAQVGEACASLIQKKFLVPDGTDTFSMTEEIRRMIIAMKDSRSCCIVYGHLMCIPMQILYFYKEDVLVLQYDELRENYFRLSYMSVSELLLQYEFLPQHQDNQGKTSDFTEEMETEEKPMELPEKLLQKTDWQQLMEEDASALLLMQFAEEAACPTLFVYRQLQQDILVWKVGDETGCKPYTRKSLEQKVMEYRHGIS